MGTVSNAPPAKLCVLSLVWAGRITNNSSGNPSIGKMVAQHREPVKRPSMVSTKPSCSAYSRKFLGLGSALPGSLGPRSMATTNGQEASSIAKELRAVLEALVAFDYPLKGKHVQIFSDNITTVSYINKQGGTTATGLMEIADDLLACAEGNLESLSADHLKGKKTNLSKMGNPRDRPVCD